MKTAYQIAKQVAKRYGVEVLDDLQLVHQYMGGEINCVYQEAYNTIIVHPIINEDYKAMLFLHELGHHILKLENDEDQNLVIAKQIGESRVGYAKLRVAMLRTEYKAWERAVEVAIGINKKGEVIDIDKMVQLGEMCLDTYHKYYTEQKR